MFTITEEQRSNNTLSDTTSKLPDVLRMLGRVDILGVPYPGDGDANKLEREINAAKYSAKTAIKNAGQDANYAWFEVFKAVYSDRLSMNAWTGELFCDGTATTQEELLDRLENALGMLSKVTSEQFNRKFEVYMQYKKFNPMMDYIRECNIKHNTVMADWSVLANKIFGTTDELSQKMLEKWLVGAVARVRTPGCQVDNMLVLQGAQGIGKSTFFRILGGQYFLDLDNATDGTEVKRQLAQAFIVELGEVEGITRKKDVEELKAFLTKTKDTFRGLYERKPNDHPRHCVFGATCNSTEVLRDATGNRRYWFIPCEYEIDREYLIANRDAIWASAYRLYLDGYQYWADKDFTALSEERNKDYQEESEYQYIVETMVGHLEKANEETGIAINVSELLTNGLEIPLERHKANRNDKKVTQVLLGMGYEKKRIRVSGTRSYVYQLPQHTSPHLVTTRDIIWAKSVSTK